MSIGRFGVGLAAKSVAPRVSLGTLFFAAQWADLLWPVLLLAGIEHVRIAPGLMKASPLDFDDYPRSHSLVALVLWGLLFGALHWMSRRDAGAAVLVGACVVSHWFLDVRVHRADLPVLPNGPYAGLGLWNSIPATLVVEGLLYIGGIIPYSRAIEPKDRIGVWSVWLWLGLLTALWIGAMFSPPPSNPQVLGISAVFGWLLLPWGYWIDRHRIVRRTPSTARIAG